MKKLLLIFILAPTLSFSQEPIAFFEDTIGPKNEIWLTFTPLVQSIIADGIPFKAEFGLMYKRRLNNKYWLRLGGLVSPPQNIHEQNGYDVIIGDSLLYSTTGIRKNQYFAGLLGVEYRTTVGKLTKFVGADLLFKYEDKLLNVVEQIHIIDSVSPLPDRYRHIRPIGEQNELYNERKTNIGGGLGFVAGLAYPVTDRISLSAQIYMDMVFSSGEIETFDKTTGEHQKSRGYGQMEFSQRLFQANALYRF
ncbi:MAG: hypothetical protein M3Q58_08130 [Bacteroidota bacterium]|nr:hypothetical protein [Bacteroidota bacterium]